MNLNLSLNYKTILKITGICLGIYLLSFLGYWFPFLNQVLFCLILIIIIILSIIKLEFGIFAVITELFIGNKGYLFSFNLFNTVISLRLALFITIFIIWLIKKLKDKEILFIKSKLFFSYTILTIFIVIGIVLGLTYGNNWRYIFFDVNGYFYFALAFVLFDVLIKIKQIKKIIQLLIASCIAICILTCVIFLDFTIFHQAERPNIAESISTELSVEGKEASQISHSTTAKSELENRELKRETKNSKPIEYRWMQDTGQGEIAYIGERYFRVFSISHLFVMITFLMALTYFLKQKYQFFKENIKNNLVTLSLLGLMFSTLLIGFSRSLWLGTIGGCIFLLLNLPRKKAIKLASFTLFFILLLIIILAVFASPIYEMIVSRIITFIHPATESASTNRINLLQPIWEKVKQHMFFGSGFGTTIEYKSVAPEKFGTLRVFAFEWAYLDTLIKIGIAGFLVYIFLFYSIFKKGYKLLANNQLLITHGKLLILSLMTGLTALLVTNITTPFLNHPLGIGYILIVMNILFILQKELNESHTNSKQT